MREGKVRIGFGLHMGWAIEGAVGSEFKVDVTYLSPNVNAASRLESANKHYGTHCLISGEFVASLSPQFTQYLRHVDTVVLAGTSRPTTVYTVDLDLDALSAREANDGPFLPFACSPGICVSHPYIVALLLHRPDFNAAFREGVDAYIRGNWASAASQLARLGSEGTGDGDGPSDALMAFMRRNDFIAPPDWPGYRYMHHIFQGGREVIGFQVKRRERARARAITREYI